jgi:hypothetical protein
MDLHSWKTPWPRSLLLPRRNQRTSPTTRRTTIFLPGAFSNDPNSFVCQYISASRWQFCRPRVARHPNASASSNLRHGLARNCEFGILSFMSASMIESKQQPRRSVSAKERGEGTKETDPNAQLGPGGEDRRGGKQSGRFWGYSSDEALCLGARSTCWPVPYPQISKHRSVLGILVVRSVILSLLSRNFRRRVGRIW